MLISAVLPIMSLYRLPHGQYAYSGHVINLPQHVASFVNSLPRLPGELDVIVVRKEGASDSHRDFRVRKSVVLVALQWLIINNKYYHSVHINHDALALLPEDGNLTALRSVTLNSTAEEQAMPSVQDVDPYNTHLPGSFVPSAARRLTEQETIRQSVQERQSDQQPVATPTLSWPPSGAIPINEFTTEGYMSCAFPTLFPTGDADSRNTLNCKMSCPKVDMTPAATCRSVNHTLTHREANALELALSRSRSPHNAPHSPSYKLTMKYL